MTSVKMLFLLAIGFICLISYASAAQTMHLTFSNPVVNSDGTATVDLIADQIPSVDGFAGYIIRLTVASPSPAKVTRITYNAAVKGMSSTTAVPFTNGTITWADTDHQLEPGSSRTSINLATITLNGITSNPTVLNAQFINLDGDGPNWSDLIPGSTIGNAVITGSSQSVTTSAPTATITTGPTPLALPDMTKRPTDPNNDGLYEDLNGDGKITDTDTTLYFQNWHWIESNEPVALFDFDHNGAIDFGDIIQLNDNKE
jgi:PKD repeat protein